MHGLISRDWIIGDAGKKCCGIFIILIVWSVAGIIRPHEDIPEHGISTLSVKDVHRVLTILKLFGASFAISPPTPWISRFLEDSIIIINERRCSIASREWGICRDLCITGITIYKHIIRQVVRIQNARPKIPCAASAIGWTYIECPANHPTCSACPVNCLTERISHINNRIIFIGVGIAFVEILGFEPYLMAPSVVGDFVGCDSMDGGCYYQQCYENTE